MRGLTRLSDHNPVYHTKAWRFIVPLPFTVGVMVSLLTVLAASSSPGQILCNDYDGDGTSDLAVYRPSEGMWYAILSSGSPPPLAGWGTWYTGHRKQWGLPGDIPAPGDYSGDGKSDFAIYRPSETKWYISCANGALPTPVTYGFNDPNQPIHVLVADYDGDQISDISFFRPLTYRWYFRYSSTTGRANYSASGATKVPGYYGSPVNANPALFRLIGSTPNALWTLLNYKCEFARNSNQYSATVFDIPVVGNYNLDFFDDYVRWSPVNGKWYDRDQELQTWGSWGDEPVSGDYDGDGVNDPCVFRMNFPYPGFTAFFVKLYNQQTDLNNLQDKWENVTWTPTIDGGYYLSWGLNADIPIGSLPAQ